MKITVNGDRRDVDASNVMELWENEPQAAETEDAKGIAIAINGAVVRRVAWAQTPLADGDSVEIVRAMQGG